MWFKLRLCAQMFVFETFMMILFWRNKTDFSRAKNEGYTKPRRWGQSCGPDQFKNNHILKKQCVGGPSMLTRKAVSLASICWTFFRHVLL